MITDKLATVETWSNLNLETGTAIEAIFKDVSIFTNMYIPVKLPTANGMPEVFEYTNIGLTPQELAAAYVADFGEQYLIADYTNKAWQKVKIKVDDVVKKNSGKYLKLIELNGYQYNPLWNVDGLETETHEGDFIHKFNETKTNSRDATDTFAPRQSDTVTTTYTGQSTDYGDVTSFDYHGSVVDPTNPSTGEEGTRKYIPKDRLIHDKSKETETVANTHNGEDVTKYTGTYTDEHTGDNTETDNRKITTERHGNIGVTKTQELIKSERENLMFNIIDVFFSDINRDILCKVFTSEVV